MRFLPRSEVFSFSLCSAEAVALSRRFLSRALSLEVMPIAIGSANPASRGWSARAAIVVRAVELAEYPFLVHAPFEQ